MSGPSVGLLRRLAAMVYDALLLLALFMVGTLAVLPLTHGKAIPPGNPIYTTYLLLIGFLFFGWFWTHGGQTVGMRAWRVRLVQANGEAVTWNKALLRFAAALLSWAVCGLGFLWALFDPEHLAWHDRLSGTRLIVTTP